MYGRLCNRFFSSLFFLFFFFFLLLFFLYSFHEHLSLENLCYALFCYMYIFQSQRKRERKERRERREREREEREKIYSCLYVYSCIVVCMERFYVIPKPNELKLARFPSISPCISDSFALIESKTLSLWSYINTHKTMWFNPDYQPHVYGLLQPVCSVAKHHEVNSLTNGREREKEI